MPLRRSHTKSRKGCLECKRRHVKCDEETPKCTLCKKRKLGCKYPASPSDIDSPTTSSSALDGLEADEDQFLPTRMLEMRLLHQYLTSTYHTLSRNGFSPYHLSITLPRMATSFPYLLDSILAFSALHLASIESDHRQSWIDAALRYQNQACSGLSKLLPGLSTAHYEPAFASSVFIMLFATGLPVISTDSCPVDPLSMVIEIRTLMVGSAMFHDRLVQTGWQGELNGWLREVDNEGGLEITRGDSSGSPGGDKKMLFDLQNKILTSLNKVLAVIETTNPDHRHLNQQTWQRLHDAVKLWPKIGEQGGILAWPYRLTDTFLALLQEGDWIARILFLHYAMAMHLIRNRWYVRDLGCRLAVAMLKSIEEIPSTWAETISWIKRDIEVFSADRMI